jgi:hypothetical protein
VRERGMKPDEPGGKVRGGRAVVFISEERRLLCYREGS